MTETEIARYLRAGYTHVVTYEMWHEFIHVWAPTHVITTQDAVTLHESACAIREKHGDVRNVHVVLLSDLLVRH